MLGAPAFKDFVFIPAESNGKLEIVDVVAGFDLAEQRRMNLQVLSCPIELFGYDPVEVEVFFGRKRCGHITS